MTTTSDPTRPCDDGRPGAAEIAAAFVDTVRRRAEAADVDLSWEETKVVRR